MAEQFSNEKKPLGLNASEYNIWGVIFLVFEGMRPKPAKTATKAQNHSKEGPINTTVGKSRVTPRLGLWQRFW